MLRTRVISAVIGISLILAIIYVGGFFWQGLVVLLALGAYYEFIRMMQPKNNLLLVVSGYLFLLVGVFSRQLGEWFFPALFAAILIMVCIKVGQYPEINIADMALALAGGIYIGFLFSYALEMGNVKQSSLAILLAFLLTWASDTGGYFGGRFWGKHKMAPQLSPKKTWEGAAGAILLTIITAFLFFMIIDMEIKFGAYVLLLGVLASIAAQLGDLFISGVKRYFAVKDTGNIIPGHGGILDRFDSFLLVVPFIYYFWSSLI